uniref:Zmp:0000001267 n=1 Tax=Maylandia zebra TaxID=106582 RepID=A0A3P9BNE7_9CICH
MAIINVHESRVCLRVVLCSLLSLNMVDKTPKNEGLQLKREIGLIGGVAIVSGTMIGSGIFMSPQYVLAYVGSPGASMLIWFFSGVVALLAALSYTELGTIIPESGGEFTYILRIYGSFPAFFAAITFILLVKPFGIAAMAMGIAQYVMAPFYPGCPPPQLAVKCFAAFSILVVAITNILNVRFALRINNCGLNTWNSSPFVFRTLEASGMTGKMFLRHQKSQNLNIYCLCLILYKKRRQIDPRLWLFSQDCI